VQSTATKAATAMPQAPATTPATQAARVETTRVVGGGVGVGNGSGGNGNGGQGGGGAGQGNGREFIYFYHPDHLGSTGYVTDEKALRYEHIAYFPFGETWVQESSATWRVPYQFTSKEMDSETGPYYFGARYYDPRTSVWQSADPILNDYLAGKRGMGGIFNPLNLGLYTYVHQNPVKFTDPDGHAPANENAPVLLLMLFKAGVESHSKGVDARHPKLNEMTPEARPLVKGVIMLQELKGHKPKIYTSTRSVDEQKAKISGGQSLP
jgi:RHS repeat-associated protein